MSHVIHLYNYNLQPQCNWCCKCLAHTQHDGGHHFIPTIVETSLAQHCCMVFGEIDGSNVLIIFVHYNWQKEGMN